MSCKSISLICLFVIFTQLISCARIDLPAEEQPIKDDGLGISVEIDKKEIAPSIIQNQAGVGPQFSQVVAQGATEREMVRGVYFADGGALSVAYVGFIKAIEQTQTEYPIVTGSGFGALIAAFYCDGRPSDQIEWFFYKLSGELRAANSRFLSAPWLKIVEKSLEEQFKEKTIQSLKRSCFLPVYNSQTNAVEYRNKGKLVPLIVANLTFSTKDNSLRSPVIHPTAISREITRFGADDITMLQIDLTAPSYERWDDYILGIYGKVNALNLLEQKNYHHFLNVQVDKMAIDSVNKFPQLIQSGMISTLKWIEQESQATLLESRGMDEE